MLPHRGTSWFFARSVREVLLRSRSDEGLELALEIVGSGLRSCGISSHSPALGPWDRVSLPAPSVTNLSGTFPPLVVPVETLGSKFFLTISSQSSKWETV